MLVAIACIEVGTEQRALHGGFPTLRTAVGDVEDTGHLVSIASFETACGEIDLLHHVRVDDGETLLHTAADEQGTIDFHAIDIHAVLVEGTSTHIVLARHLVVRTYTCLGSHHFFHGIARSGRHTLDILGIERLVGAHLPLHFLDGDLIHLAGIAAHHDVEGEVAAGILEHLAARLIPHEGIGDDHAVTTLKVKGVLSLQVGEGTSPTLREDRDEPHGFLVFIDNPTLEVYLGTGGYGSTVLCLLGREGQRACKKQEKQDKRDPNQLTVND